MKDQDSGRTQIADPADNFNRVENLPDQQTIRQLFQDYVRMYSSRDDQLTTRFSQDFTGFTGGGDFLVKDHGEWVAITRQDFAQVTDPIRIEIKDLAIQSLADTIAVATGLFLFTYLLTTTSFHARRPASC